MVDGIKEQLVMQQSKKSQYQKDFNMLKLVNHKNFKSEL
jgi:hypothetical protein